jgi:hypothetical protein
MELNAISSVSTLTQSVIVCLGNLGVCFAVMSWGKRCLDSHCVHIRDRQLIGEGNT